VRTRRTRQVQLTRAVRFATVGLALGVTLEFVFQMAGNGLFIVACSAVGLLTVSRRPGNIIGWIYTLFALVLAAGVSKRPWTAASAGESTTLPGPSRRSAPGYATRST
jgi:hypothetical protein